jgi:hypothetical protein
MKTRVLVMAIIMMLTMTTKILAASYNQVVSVIQDENFIPRTEIEVSEFSIYDSLKLPQYPVNAKSLFMGGSAALEKDAIRTVNERFDFYDRLPKKLHPNGVCVLGKWQIDTQTKYSGYFSEGSEGLFVGRISVAMEDTTSDDSRGFGIAGKIFPTLNPDEEVQTGNFFTVDVLLGAKTQSVFDTKTTNEPELGFKFSLIGLAMKISSALKKADDNILFRPLTQVASLKTTEVIKQPKWLRLSFKNNIIRNNEKDFRNEVLRAFEDNSEVTYTIEISETTHDRSAKTGWSRIGEIKLNQAIVSYGCDRRLHFAHPKLK